MAELFFSDGKNVWRYTGSDSPHLGEGKWDWIGGVATGIGTAVAGYWTAKTAAKYGSGQQPQMQYLGPPPGYDSGGGQIIKGVDNTTLMIGAIAALLFFMMPPGKK